MKLTNRQELEIDTMWKYIKQFIEQTGIYLFFVSLMLFTQINWIRKHVDRYTELNIEVRLLAGFSIGMLLSFWVIRLIKKIAVKTNKEPQALLNNLSIALAPGIFFLFASKNKNFLIIGAILCVLAALYLWVKSFRDFIKSFLSAGDLKAVLTIQDGKAVINIRGIYEKASPKALQSFLTDLVINFYECSEMKIEEIKIDFSKLEGKDRDELKPIIEAVAGYFNLRVIYTTAAISITETNNPRVKVFVMSFILVLSVLAAISLFVVSNKNLNNKSANSPNTNSPNTNSPNTNSPNTNVGVINGNFDNDTNGWTPHQSTLSVVGDGQSGNALQITAAAADTGYAYFTVPTKSDQMYKITAWYKRGTASNAQIKVGTSMDSLGLYYSGVLSNEGWTQYSGVFKAATMTTYVTLVNLTSIKGQTSFFDSIVISKE